MENKQTIQTLGNASELTLGLPVTGIENGAQGPRPHSGHSPK